MILGFTVIGLGIGFIVKEICDIHERDRNR